MKNRLSARTIIILIILLILLFVLAGGAVDVIKRGGGFLFVPSFTPSATNTSTPTETPTTTASPTTTPTLTATATYTATLTATSVPTATATDEPTATLTPIPTTDVTALAGEIYTELTLTSEALLLLLTPSATPTLLPADLVTGLEMIDPIDGKTLTYIQKKSDDDMYGFWIDRNEVSNREYMACIQAGSCTAPGSRLLENRPYFSDGYYADFPMVNVTKSQAEAYCTWAGMQLMSLQDWYDAVEILPSSSVNTDRVAAGPRRNTPENSDLVGNVWEWVSSESEDGSGIISGGSWKTASQDANLLRLGRMNIEQFADDVGFRCVLYMYGGTHE